MSNCPSFVQVAINQPQQLIIFPGTTAAQLNTMIMSTFGISATTPAQLLAWGGSKGGSVVFTTGQYCMETSVYVPANVSLIFETGAILNSSLPGYPLNMASYIQGYIFLVNSTTGTGWTWTFPNLHAATIQGMYWNCANDQAATQLPTPIYLAAPHRVTDIRADYPAGLITATSEYMDSFVVENVMVYKNRSVSTITGPFLGDNLHLKNINGCNINVSGCRGGVVNGLINSSITVTDCSAFKIMGVHYEGNSVITIQDSDVEIDGIFAYRNTITSSIVITASDDESQRTVSIKNAQFADIMTETTLGSGIFNFNPASALNKPDIQTMYSLNLSLENCSSTYYSNYLGHSNSDGIVLCDSNGSTTANLTGFNNYSHLLSASCKLIGWNVVSGNNSIDAGNNGFAPNEFIVNTSLSWTIAAGTYHYSLFAIQDKERFLGLGGGGDYAVTVGTNGLSAFMWLPGGFPAIVRVYRGLAANSYDHYVDVPSCGTSTLLFEDGNFVNGRQWLTRTAGPADPFMPINGLELSFINANGTNSPNKNLATILAPSLPPATLPSGGNYTVGDTVRLPITHPNTQYEYVWDGTIWAVKGIATTAASSVTVPASGVALPAAIVKGMYLVSGGVLTVIGITRGGVATNTTVSLTGAIIPVNPGDTVALSYTSAPAAIEFMPL